MSALTHSDSPAPARESFVPAGHGLSFSGLLRSESIKLWSLRSTYWTFSLVIVFAIGIAIALAFTLSGYPANGVAGAPTETGLFVMVATAGLGLGQLIVAVLGVLSISGEYSSGMIKSTLTAVPRRLAALWAKAVVLFSFTFAVGLVSVLGGFAVALPIMARNDLHASLFDSAVLLPLLGNALFLALLAVFSLGIGTIVRSSAGGIATALGILLLLPTLLGLFSLLVGWVSDLMPFLLTSAGAEMITPNTMESWQALLVVLGWVAVSLGGAALLLKRRDA